MKSNENPVHGEFLIAKKWEASKSYFPDISLSHLLEAIPMKPNKTGEFMEFRRIPLDLRRAGAEQPGSNFHLDAPTPRVCIPAKATGPPGGTLRRHNIWRGVTAKDFVYVVWFNAGLRIVDISDSFRPQEVGYYVSEGPPQSNDVFVDERGHLHRRPLLLRPGHRGVHWAPLKSSPPAVGGRGTEGLGSTITL